MFKPILLAMICSIFSAKSVDKNKQKDSYSFFTKRVNQKLASTQNVNQETWESIIQSLVQFNPKVKAAYTTYATALAKSGLSFSNIILPETISFHIDNRQSDIKEVLNFSSSSSQVLKVQTNFGLYAILDAGHSSFDAAAALSEYHLSVVRELSDLFESIFLLIQKGELIAAYQNNLDQLERSYKSVKTRSDDSIGLSSTADLYNAKSEYENGVAELLYIKQAIKQAEEKVRARIGRDLRLDLSALKTIPINPTSIDNAPEVKAAFNAYKAARIGSWSANSRLFLPYLSLAAERGMGDMSNNTSATAGISFDIYNRRNLHNHLDHSQKAKTSLELYKYAKQNYQSKYNLYQDQDKTHLQRLEALNQANLAAQRYAQAETRKFENAFQITEDAKILSPENMLLALRRAHRSKVELMEMTRKFWNHRIMHLLEFGVLYSSNKNPSRK